MARLDPYKNFRFLVEIDAIVQAGFADCTGFGSHVEPVEYREGGDANEVRKLPGRVTYPDITLKWGVTDSHDLYDWHLEYLNGHGKPRSGAIILQDDAGQERIRWNFRAWPTKWEGAALSAKGNDVAIESLTLSCERLQRVK
jgi:phage tail-like protein